MTENPTVKPDGIKVVRMKTVLGSVDISHFCQSNPTNRCQPISANAPVDDCLAYTPLGCMPPTLVACGTASTE